MSDSYQAGQAKMATIVDPTEEMYRRAALRVIELDPEPGYRYFLDMLGITEYLKNPPLRSEPSGAPAPYPRMRSRSPMTSRTEAL